MLVLLVLWAAGGVSKAPTAAAAIHRDVNAHARDGIISMHAEWLVCLCGAAIEIGGSERRCEVVVLCTRRAFDLNILSVFVCRVLYAIIYTRERERERWCTCLQYNTHVRK